MGRYLLGDQVWSIEREPTQTQIRIVEDGVERIETFVDAATTALRFTILTKQKLRAGWKLEREPVRAPPVVLAKPPEVFDARNPELEAAIIADPDADEAWEIYGDWLQQQGDPRGEMIARCAAAKLDPKQQHRVQLRENAYHEYFYGGLHASRFGLSLRWGFIHTITLHRFDDTHEHVKTVLTNPAARFVGEIHIGSDEEDDLRRALNLVIKYAPQTLRTLGLTGPLADLAPVAKLLPKLHALALQTETSIAPLVAVKAPQLRAFEAKLATDEVAPTLAWIDRAMPRLVDLRLFATVDLDLLEHAQFAQRIETLRLEGPPDRIVALFPNLRKVCVGFGTNHAAFRARGIEVEEEEDDHFEDAGE